jgi:hypothetical protein
MPAIAFSNNDIALVAWTFDRHLDDCLGFAIHQIDASGKDTVLPALARFATQDENARLRSRSSGGKTSSQSAARPTSIVLFQWGVHPAAR